MMGKYLMSVFALLVISFGTLAAPDREVRIAVGEWPPFMSQALEHGGVLNQIVTEAFATSGVRVVYGYFPWRRSFEYPRKGFGVHSDEIWHATSGWIYSEQRNKDFLFSAPIMRYEGVFFYLKENPLHWKEVEALNGKRIGVTTYGHFPMLEQLNKQGIITLVRGGTDAVLLKRLLYRDLDAIVDDKLSGLYQFKHALSEQEQLRITHDALPVVSNDLHLIFSRNVEQNNELIRLFNQGLSALHQSGRYSEIVNKLLGSDVE